MSNELSNAIYMFAFLAIELSTLFIGISFLVGILQNYVSANKLESLSNSNHFKGNLLAALLGAMTPFCSCSTIPMLKGLIRAKAGFGPMMVFLFTSPLLNPVIIVLLIVTFGLKLTTVYVLAALITSLAAGWFLQTLRFDRYIKPIRVPSPPQGEDLSSCTNKTKEKLYKENRCNKDNSNYSITSNEIISTENYHEDEQTNSASNKQCCNQNSTKLTPDKKDKNCCTAEFGSTNKIHKKSYKILWQQAWADYKNVLPYLLFGIAIGSLIYGFMPINLLEKYAGSDNPLAIPVAAIIGIPLYIRAEAVIPLAAALITKGVGAGTVLALIIGSAGASLTELILLRSLFRTKLLVSFVVVIITMAIIAGYMAYLFY